MRTKKDDLDLPFAVRIAARLVGAGRAQEGPATPQVPEGPLTPADQAVEMIRHAYVDACRAPGHQSPQGTTAPTLDSATVDQLKIMLEAVDAERIRNMPLASLCAQIGATLAGSTEVHSMNKDFTYWYYKPRNQVNVHKDLDTFRREMAWLRRDVHTEEVPAMNTDQQREIEGLIDDAAKYG